MGQWLRIGKRRELIILLLLVFGCAPLVISAAIDRPHDLLFLTIIIIFCIGLILVFYVPTLIYLRWRRKQELAAESEAQPDPQRSPALSRGQVYALMTVITFFFAMFQARHLAPGGQPTLHFIKLVFFWNFVALTAIIGLNEVSKRRKDRRN